MPAYVDGFVLPLPKKNVQAYCQMAKKAGKIWREHGALEYRECVGNDLKVKWGPKMMEGKSMPFDSKRMLYGGFKILVEA